MSYKNDNKAFNLFCSGIVNPLFHDRRKCLMQKQNWQRNATSFKGSAYPDFKTCWITNRKLTKQ